MNMSQKLIESINKVNSKDLNEDMFSEIPEYFKENNIEIYARYHTREVDRWNYIAKLSNQGWVGVYFKTIISGDDKKVVLKIDDTTFDYTKRYKNPESALKKVSKLCDKIEYFSK